MIRLFIIFAFLFSAVSALAQTDTIVLGKDTATETKAQKKAIYSRARRASIMSAVVPGLGQAYNHKYWKLPIIYAGLGGFGYMFVSNNKQYNLYHKNLAAWYDNDSSTVNTLTQYNGQQLKDQKLYYRKYRDFAIIGLAIVYLINVVDANVDAHLRTFDVSDDLSIHIDPWQNTYRTATGYKMATGLTIKLNFK